MKSKIPSSFTIKTIETPLEGDPEIVRVIPVLNKKKVVWFDLAGYEMAESKLEIDLGEKEILNYDFNLDFSKMKVLTERYL